MSVMVMVCGRCVALPLNALQPLNVMNEANRGGTRGYRCEIREGLRERERESGSDVYWYGWRGVMTALHMGCCRAPEVLMGCTNQQQSVAIDVWYHGTQHTRHTHTLSLYICHRRTVVSQSVALSSQRGGP